MEYHPMTPLPQNQQYSSAGTSMVGVPPTGARNIPILDFDFNHLLDPLLRIDQHLYRVLPAYEEPVNSAIGGSLVTGPASPSGNERYGGARPVNANQEGEIGVESRANRARENDICQTPAEIRRMKHKLSQREYRVRKRKREGIRIEAYEAIIRDLSAENKRLEQDLKDVKQKVANLALCSKKVVSMKDYEQLTKMEEEASSGQ